LGESTPIEVLQQSNLASIRLRICPSIKAMLAKQWMITTGDQIIDTPQKIVVTKIGVNDIQKRSKQWIEQIESHKSRGAQIYLDYTDHHLGFGSAMSDFYRQVIVLVNKVIVPSKVMQINLSNFFKQTIDIVKDPIEITTQTIKFNKSINGPITLLWFGHSSNIEYLLEFMRTGFEAGDSLRIIVLSNQAGLNMFTQAKIESCKKIGYELGIWSPELMLYAATKSDACIIPANVFDPRKSGASSNRLVTAFALGLPVAADHLDSYLEFSKFYADLRSSEFRRLIQNPLEFHLRASLAQSEVVPKFTMTESEVAWSKALL